MKALKLVLNILNIIVFGCATAIAVLMATTGGMLGLGIVLALCSICIGTAFWSLINLTDGDRQKLRDEAAQKRVIAAKERDAKGVHWVWWVLCLLVFFPALIVVAIVHSGRKNRAAMRELAVMAPAK
ncbi:hypothetical protein [Tateyamaria sp.]|uniref:hypothetical protein n=1 Tax=Tateyamaria sp. TaxID=1929288 RepID=UPI0032A084DE